MQSTSTGPRRYMKPPAEPDYVGAEARFVFGDDHGSIEMPRTMPDWMMMNAMRTAKEYGWRITDEFDTTEELQIIHLARP